jgi:hypothetical protein
MSSRWAGWLEKGDWKVATLLAVAVFLASAALTAPRAGGAVYWNNVTQIGAANMDGSEAQPHYYTPMTSPGYVAPGCGIAVNDSYLYSRQGFDIDRVSLDGSPTAEVVAGGIGQGCGLAIDSSHLYWTDFKSGSIGRATLDGADSNATFIPGLQEPCDVAVDGQYIYWSDLWGISRARLDGTQVTLDYIKIAGFPCGLAVYGQYIYWGIRNGSAIGRAHLNGSARGDAFIVSTGAVVGLAANSTHLFWANQLYDGSVSAIGRATLDGAGVEQTWIPSLRTTEFGVAVDSRPEPPAISLRIPSRPIQFGKVTHNRQTGVAYLDVVVPTRGELAVAAPRVGWKVLEGHAPDWVIGSFTWHLKIWPGKKGLASKRIRRQLRLKGRASIDLHVTYSEENRGPVLAHRRLVLARVKRP